MNYQMLDQVRIELVPNGQEPPYELLELADPSRDQINSYLKTGECYIATADANVVGVLVLIALDSKTLVIKNIAVDPSMQGKGLGKMLLRFAEKRGQHTGYHKLRIGTGNSSTRPLTLYQKEGFEIRGIDKDFFLRNYTEPLFENGIQCRDMILLEKQILQNPD